VTGLAPTGEWYEQFAREQQRKQNYGRLSPAQARDASVQMGQRIYRTLEQRGWTVHKLAELIDPTGNVTVTFGYTQQARITIRQLDRTERGRRAGSESSWWPTVAQFEITGRDPDSPDLVLATIVTMTETTPPLEER